MWESFDTCGSFKGVQLTKSDADGAHFNGVKSQFNQCLLDNITARFPSSEILNNAAVLNAHNWPTDCLERALFGDREVASLCKQLSISSSLIVEILSDFKTYKETLKVGTHLKGLISKISVYPISSADCERGFSHMNQQHTDSRNRLKTETVNALLMISVNGPFVEHVKCHEYVLSWLKKGRHSATDKPTGKKRRAEPVDGKRKLFASNSKPHL